MTRAPARSADHDRDLPEVNAAVLALARLLGEAAAREACLDAAQIEDDADAREFSEDD